MKKANFLKRAFAFIVDSTIVILATVLLYLFPFSMIINKSIDTDYKTNVGDVVNTINAKYSGSSSVFGTSTDGLLSTLGKYYSGDLECNNEIVDEYVLNHTNLLNKTNLVVNNLVDNQSNVYDASSDVVDTYYAQLYEVYGYLLYSYNCLYSFKMNDSYETYQDIKTRDDLTSSQVSELEDEYINDLTTDFGNALNVLVKAFNSYKEVNPDLDVTKLISYKTINQQAASVLGSSNVSKESVITEDDVDYIREFINRYEDFFDYVKTNALRETKLNQKAYYSFYYDLLIMQFNELLPVHDKYSTHSTIVILYALIAFTVLYTIYTFALKGKTIGRRVDKIKIINSDGTENINIIQLLLHDVLFGFGYLILVGCLDVRIMLIVALVFLIADAIMIKVTKTSKTIRNYISQTIVVSE